MKKVLITLGLGFFLLFDTNAVLSNSAAKSVNENALSATRAIFTPKKALERFDEPTLIFHYFRNDGKYDDFDFWLWDGGDGEGYKPTENDDFGKYFTEPLSTFTSQTGVSWIIRKGGDSWSGQTIDMRLSYADFDFDDTLNAYHFYFINSLTRVYKTAEEAKANQVYRSSFKGAQKIEVITNNEPSTFNFRADGVSVISGNAEAVNEAEQFRWSFSKELPANFAVSFTSAYVIEVGFSTGPSAIYTLGFEGLFDDSSFVSAMTYNGNDLGVTYTPEKTVFKAWAPTISKLVLRIYENGTPKSVSETLGSDTFDAYNFVAQPKGVWEVTVNKDLHDKYYTFVATHPDGDVELIDPYAKSAGVNGIRGHIVDFSKTNPVDWDLVDYSVKKPTEIIPYEIHVADITSDETWNGSEANRKKYLGLSEAGTTYTKDGVTVKTGFDHIKELGVNALQIIPFYDQQNNEIEPGFNWGYNPQNYNVLEGSYSSNPYDGLVRIREFKQVVKAYAAEDIRIIMDVVYNHVANIGSHSFNKLVPGYYFRYNSEGSPDNSSGVGNVTASERIMMENYMRDSTAFWTDEYKIGGFRFDLMGLHTTESMNTVSEALREIRSDIIIYGEPWNMNNSAVKDPMAIQSNLDKIPYVGAFNDQIRNGFVSNAETPPPGWIQLEPAAMANSTQMKRQIIDGLRGHITDSKSTPAQTVNYAAAHDNYTLYDKLTLAGTRSKTHFSTETIGKQSLQTDSMVLLSQGISFIHGGSDILRSKPTGEGVLKFDYNSYKSSYEINSFKWDEKVDNLAIFNDYQTLINLKKNTPALHYTTSEEVATNVSATLGSEIKNSTLEDNFIQLIAQDAEYTYVALFYGMGLRINLDGLDGYTVLLDTSKNLEPNTVINNTVTMQNNTTLVLQIKTSAYNPGFTTNLSPKKTNLTWVYVTIPSLLVLGGGIGGLLFFFVKKRKKIGV